MGSAIRRMGCGHENSLRFSSRAQLPSQFKVPAGDGAVGGEAEQVGEGREVEGVEQGLAVFFVEPGEVVFHIDQDNDRGSG